MEFTGNTHIFGGSIFSIILLLQTCLQVNVMCDTCSTADNSPTSGPQLPYLDDVYQVGVECNILDKGYTVETTVYYDFDGNRATTVMFRNGLEGKLIYNYGTDEIFSISNDICTVSKLSTSNLTQEFGLLYSNGLPHINHPQTAFKFGKQFNEVYIGMDTVRGMPVNHWRNCTSSPVFRSLTTNYYFSANWSTASSIASVPIRAEVQAIQLLPNGTTYNLHHIYDFFSYRPGQVDDTSIFQTPKGVVCPGRKNSRTLPSLPKRFYYRTEKIYTDVAAVTFEDTWYDESFRLFRRDYRPLVPEYPTYTLHPTTEIHDYNTGVRYVIDKSFGNCTALPLPKYSMDTIQNFTASKQNGSFVLNMKNPLQLFKLDWNYTYVGQYKERGILCDVYVAVRDHMYFDGFVNNATVTVTFYFLAQEWTDVADNEAEKNTVGTPVKMELTSEQTGLTAYYNFLDFDPEPPNLEVFDISKCYNEANEKITFQLKFPGRYDPTTGTALKEWSQLTLSQKMGVAVLRISQVHLDYDDANIFVTATLLGKTMATAQFTFTPGQTFENSDDSIVHNTDTPFQCADLCVNNKPFTCNSFDYCGNDRSCRLSMAHVDDGIKTSTSKTCDHFSRSVNGLAPERSIKDAYQQLRLHVYNQSLQLNHILNKEYTAVDVAIIFGWVDSSVKLPTLSDQFSYRLEVAVPATNHVYSSSVWFDKAYQLGRYDQHYKQPMFPFYSTNPMSVIEDYKTGLRYVIDQHYQNCTVDQLTIQDYGSAVSGNTSVNATSHVFMMNPLTALHIDNTYSFVGQQTIRGMTCNIFESLRTDFRLPTVNKSVNSVFRYAFLADDWNEVSDGYLGASSQPVRLEITVLQFQCDSKKRDIIIKGAISLTSKEQWQKNNKRGSSVNGVSTIEFAATLQFRESFYLEFNMYDFDTDHPDLSVFDTHQCYTNNQTKHFQITFPGQYHPYLETQSNIFEIASVFKMSVLSGAAVLRFQRAFVDYDKDNIYLTATLVEETNNLLYFTKISHNATSKFPVDKMADAVTSPGVCADACISNTGFDCTKFIYCPFDTECLLNKEHETDETQYFYFENCDYYSKTSTGPDEHPSNLFAFIRLKNNIYLGNLSIAIPVSGTDTTKTFKASSIRDDIVTKETFPKGKAFEQFIQVSTKTSLNAPDSQLYNIAIDDCAEACVTCSQYQCNGFVYSPDTFVCSLSKAHTDQMNASLVNNSANWYLYSRKYVYDYIQYDSVVIETTSDTTIPNIPSDEQCARLCSVNKNVQCRSFLYCGMSQNCLLFSSRRVGKPGPSKTRSTCNYYRSTYEFDFKPINAGLFTISSVLNVEGTLSDCSTFCIEQKGDNCKGMYYCSKTSICYLTSATPGDGSGIVTSSSQSNDFCEYYTRTYSPPVLQPSTPPAVTPTGTTVPVKLNITTTMKTMTPSVWVSMKSTGISATHSSILPTALSQTQKDNASSNTGTLIGVSFGTFALGLILGGVGVYLFRRYRGKKDDLHANFIMHEDM